MPEAVEIWFEIEKDSDGYPESQKWEQLYAWPVDGGFQLDNVPFFAKNVAVGDIVEATQTDEGWYRFGRVLKTGGHSAFRIWLAPAMQARCATIIAEIRNMGGQAEVTLERLIGIDAAPEVEEVIWNYLEEGRHRGDWEVQVGCSPD